MLKNTPSSYGIVTKAFHWTSALIVIGMLAAGLYMTRMGKSPGALQLYNLHKSFGVVVLCLVTLRLFWHLYSKKPAYVASLEPWEKTTAHVVHIFLYIAMFVMPLSGWLMSSAGGRPVSFFGLFTLPDLIGQDQGYREIFGTLHDATAYALMAAIVLHVAGALKHAVIDKDGTLGRMLPFGRKKQ